MHRKLRNWIDHQNTQLGEKVKEAKQKVLDAKDKVINILVIASFGTRVNQIFPF